VRNPLQNLKLKYHILDEIISCYRNGAITRVKKRHQPTNQAQ